MRSANYLQFWINILLCLPKGLWIIPLEKSELWEFINYKH